MTSSTNKITAVENNDRFFFECDQIKKTTITKAGEKKYTVITGQIKHNCCWQIFWSVILIPATFTLVPLFSTTFRQWLWEAVWTGLEVRTLEAFTDDPRINNIIRAWDKSKKIDILELKIEEEKNENINPSPANDQVIITDAKERKDLKETSSIVN